MSLRCPVVVVEHNDGEDHGGGHHHHDAVEVSACHEYERSVRVIVNLRI